VPTTLAVATLLGAGSAADPAAAQTPAGELAAHRAVYELKLANTRSKSTVSARGRILYDFTGSLCEGYKLEFRRPELDNGEGKQTLSDLRSTTGRMARPRITHSNHRIISTSVWSTPSTGRPSASAGWIAVTLTKPKDKKADLDTAIVFPTEHVRRIITAAREGKPILEFPVFDGSETGEKVYNTLTVIGHVIAPDQKVPTDAAAGVQALAA
jgi:hypothetical protein